MFSAKTLVIMFVQMMFMVLVFPAIEIFDFSVHAMWIAATTVIAIGTIVSVCLGIELNKELANEEVSA